MNVLRGNFHQNNRKYGERSTGIQCTAMPAAAVCFGHVKHPTTSDRRDIDQCLDIGDKLYRMSIKVLGERGEYLHQYLRPSELSNQECVRDNLEVGEGTCSYFVVYGVIGYIFFSLFFSFIAYKNFRPVRRKPVAHDAFFRAVSVAGFSYLAPGMGPLLGRARTRCLQP